MVRSEPEDKKNDICCLRKAASCRKSINLGANIGFNFNDLFGYSDQTKREKGKIEQVK